IQYSAAPRALHSFPTRRSSDLAALEAMARGKPVVATQVGGIPEIIQPGVTGLLVPPGNDATLAQAIASLLANPTTAAEMGRNARSEEHTSELQSRFDLVCRLLL